MNARRLARGLGWFSIGLGFAEMVAPGRISRRLGLHGEQGSVQAFGLREVLSGAAILMSKGRAPQWVWLRVAGDLMDMGLLQSATPVDGKRRTNLNVAKTAVLGAAALDMITAQKLSRQQRARRRRVMRGTVLQQRRFI